MGVDYDSCFVCKEINVNDDCYYIQVRDLDKRLPFCDQCFRLQRHKVLNKLEDSYELTDSYREQIIQQKEKEIATLKKYIVDRELQRKRKATEAAEEESEEEEDEEEPGGKKQKTETVATTIVETNGSVNSTTQQSTAATAEQ